MFFSNSKNGETVLILDIQSSIVRGSLVYIKEVGKPSVLFTYSVPVPFKRNTNSSYLIKTTMRAITETNDAILRFVYNNNLSKDIPKKISEVHYVLSSPWIISQAKTVYTKFEKDKTITVNYLEDMIDQEIEKIDSSKKDEICIIEKKIFDVCLNGYSINNWKGKTTKELSTSFVISIAGKRTMERLTEACEHITSRRHVFFHSCLLLQHIGIHEVIPSRDNYTLVHVHGELTDVTIVERGSCVFFGSYPFGVMTLIRKIASSAKTNNTAAESLLSLHTGKHFDDNHASNITKIISNTANGWKNEMQKLLRAGSTSYSNIGSIILSSANHESFFTKRLQELYPGTKIELLSIDDLLTHVEYDNWTERLRLTGLYAIAIHSMKNHRT